MSNQPKEPGVNQMVWLLLFACLILLFSCSFVTSIINDSLHLQSYCCNERHLTHVLNKQVHELTWDEMKVKLNTNCSHNSCNSNESHSLEYSLSLLHHNNRPSNRTKEQGVEMEGERELWIQHSSHTWSWCCRLGDFFLAQKTSHSFLSHIFFPQMEMWPLFSKAKTECTKEKKEK